MISRSYLKVCPSIYALLIWFSHLLLSNAESCLVTAWWGTYQGNLNVSVLRPDFLYCSYRDIRYGEAMLGDRRFGKSMLATPEKSGVYDATQDRITCAQPNSSDLDPEINEDCLFLNVYTPQIDSKKEITYRAVMVYIHGGAYTYGSKSSVEFSPDYLVPHDVVLVTINYRLNVFGFLNLGIKECNGNMGLRDQIVALEWIQKNIRSFGGDPKKVTLMGQSAGAISVYLLQLSPLAQGLFDRSIIESALTTDKLMEDVFAKTPAITVHHALEFAKFMGYKGNTKHRHAILRYFRGLSSAVLAKGYGKFMTKLTETDGSYFYAGPPFWPYQDKGEPDAILPYSCAELGEAAPNISYIIGYNDADGDAYSYPLNPYSIVDYVRKHMDLYLRGTDPIFVKNNRTLEAVTANVTKYYYEGKNKLDATVRLLTYFSYDDFYKQIAVFRSSYTNKKVWVYEFRYASGYQHYKQALLGPYSREVKGVSHSEELGYLFYAPLYLKHGFNATKKELEVINKMTTWWTNFAKYGNPNSHFDDIEQDWEPTGDAQDNYLQIGETINFISNEKILREEREFFDKLRQFARHD